MSERQQAEQSAAAWIAKRDAGAWTNEDAAAFNAWLSASASHRAAYYRFNGAWQESGRLKALIGTPSLLPLSRERERTRVRALLPWSLAATLVLAIAGAFLASQSGLFARNTYSTVIGGLQAVPMPDGSRVTLNTNSQIRLAITEKERLVELKQGEAFFEVAKDPSRPFVVSAAGQRIVAVGTAFSVRREGDDVRVLISEGAVRFSLPSPPLGEGRGEGSSLLPAGTTARTSHGNLLVQKKPLPEIEQTLSWRSGLLTFRDTPLSDAVAEFNRYNERKIVIEDPSIADIQVGGIFRATNLDPFVALLQDGFPVRARMDEKRIVLMAR